LPHVAHQVLDLLFSQTAKLAEHVLIVGAELRLKCLV
jgi:hypothetical protein